ncbi:MAG: type II toxin-antitoxin system RelE/ParE family toxin [FCB group bacterium]|jgi:phage-related protein
MDEYRVDFVELESGNIPFEKFLNSVSKAERAEIITMIEELRRKLSESEKISVKISKYIRDGIFELRIKHLNKISRSFYFFQIGKLIVFTHGFIKKTQPIPFKEIDKAIKYKKIYEQRLK